MSVEKPARLVDRAFLVPYDVDKHKLTAAADRSNLVRAAALIELVDRGLLTDQGGRPRVSGGRSGDPVLDDLVDLIGGSASGSWQKWVDKDHKHTYRAVRERLATERVISVSQRRVIGVFPTTEVTVTNPAVVQDLIRDLRRAVLGGAPMDQLDAGDVVLVALVAAIELGTVFSGRERREHRDRIGIFTERAGPVARGLRSVFESRRAAAAV